MTFPDVLDSTMINTFRSCPRKYFYDYMLSIQPKGSDMSVHLRAGGAFAAGLESARRSALIGGNAWHKAAADGFRALTTYYGNYVPLPKYRAKDYEHVVRAYAQYLMAFPPAEDHIQILSFAGAPAIEWTFAIPIPISHPDTGQPIIYGGKVDWYGEYRGMKTIVDEKTTGMDRMQKWSLRAQFQGYMWAAQQHGISVGACIVRKVIMHVDDVKFQQIPLYPSEWRLDRWYEQLLRDVNRMVECYRAGYWDFNLGDACNTYGGCIFGDLCDVNNPDPWIEVNFEPREKWNPLHALMEG
jgi:PD-(D/E)XK nuclease superfamily